MGVTYSSGLISQSFWFVEIKKLIKLINDGKSEEEIKTACLEENLFCAAKEYRARRMYGYIWKRIKSLDKQLTELFVTSDLATQKIINLIAVLKNDRLFFEFLFEVYREKIILGVPALESSDTSIFFKDKDIQNAAVAEWTDETKRKLSYTYTNFMTESGLLKVKGKQRMITPPILDVALERYLMTSGNVAVLKAITGVN